MRRLAVLLTSAALLVAAPQAPALAGADRPDAEVRELVERHVAQGPGTDGPAVDGSVGAPARHFRAIVTDPAGDASEPRPVGTRDRLTWSERLADVRRVGYKTPVTSSGLIRVAARWTRLRNAERGAVKQTLVTLITAGRRGLWVLVADNRGNVRLFDANADTSAEGRIRPEVLTLERSHGRGGEMTVRVSTEWLPAQRVRFSGYGTAGEAFDEVRTSRPLDVAPGRD